MKQIILLALAVAALCGLAQGQINVSSGSQTRSGTLNSGNLGASAPDLVKTGAGELILRGNNEAPSSAFTGTAFINAGTLTVDGTLFSPGGRAIPNGSRVEVASGARFQVKWSESIGSLTGLGNVDVQGRKLTILGAGTFSGTLNNNWSLFGGSTEFRNGATVQNGTINNAWLSGVVFNHGTADNATINNSDGGAYALFENGASSLGSSITNRGPLSNVVFDNSTADDTSILNDGAGSFAKFLNGAQAENGTVVENNGALSFVTFVDSTIDGGSILNQGLLSSATFTNATAQNETTIENRAEASFTHFLAGSSAVAAEITNTGNQSTTWFNLGSIARESSITNQGESSGTLFNFSSIADGSSILNAGQDSFVLFGSGSSAVGGTTIRNSGSGAATVFSDSSAGRVTIVNENGAGAVTRFEGQSTGSSETTIENGAGGLLDISELAHPSLTIGRLFGDGDIELGSNNLSIGSQNHVLDTIGGSISGKGGSLTKEGTGTVILTGSSSVGVVVNVIGGTLELNGSFAAVDGFKVNPGSVLKGSGTLQGDVFNNGIVAPGNSPGVLTIIGDFVQSSAGTFELEIAGFRPALFDRLVVSGRMDLDGTLDVVPFAPLTGFLYGDRVNFLHADGGIFGTFRQVLVPSPDRFRGRFFKPDANTGSLVIAPASYTLVARGPNDLSLARALDQWIGIETGDIGEVTLALDLLREEQYAGAFAAIEPGYYAGALNTQLETSHAVGRMLDHQLSSRRLGGARETAGPPHPTVDFWVQGSGVFSSGGLSLLPGAEFDSGNLMAGGSVALTPALAIGFFGDFGEGWTDVSGGGGGNIDYERSFFGGYVTYDVGRFYFHAAAGGGSSDFDIDRPIQFGTLSRRASSNPESEEALGLVTVGYEMPLGSDGWYLEPQASLQYSCAQLGPVSETGAESLNLRFDDASADSLRTYLGGRLARRIAMKSGSVLTPFLHAQWVREYLRDGDSFDAALDGGNGPTFRYLMTDPEENSLFGGAGLNYVNAQGVNFNVNYNVDLGRSNPDHGVALGIGIRF